LSSWGTSQVAGFNVMITIFANFGQFYGVFLENQCYDQYFFVN
jgi:hypothetical protein